MNIENGFGLIGLMDGTTINAFLRVEGTPLVQRYNKSTSQFVPDIEALADNIKPTAVLILRDSTDGSLLTASTIVWMYNGIVLTFDANGLSSNTGMVGVFKRLDAHTTTVGSASVAVPALRVMKNLVPLSGYDNDRLSVSGDVEVGGAQIPFAEISKEVIIQESTGNQYDVMITNNKGSQILTTSDIVAEKARIYKDGIEVVDLTGYAFKWYKLLSTGDTAWGTSQTQNVAADDVDNVLKLRCDVLYNNTVVGSGYDEVTDFTDPIIAQMTYSGISGNVVKSGQTALLTPKAYKRSTGEEVALTGNWNWNIKNNAGEAFILTGKTSATFAAKTASITYADMKRAGMGLSGSYGYSN